MTPEEKVQVLETDALLTEIAYRHAELAVGRSTEHFARLDTKATTLTGVVGLITTILVTVAATGFRREAFSSWLMVASALLMIICLVLLFVSMAYCLAALHVRGIQDVPLTREVLAALLSFDRRPGDDVQLKKRLLLPLSRVDYAFAFESRQKATHLRAATNWLCAAFIALALAGLCYTIDRSIQIYERHRPASVRSTANSQQ